MGQGGLSRKAQQVQEDSRRKGIQGSTSREEIKCVCLNARSIINKKDELNIMVDDIKPHCQVTHVTDLMFIMFLCLFNNQIVSVAHSRVTFWLPPRCEPV